MLHFDLETTKSTCWNLVTIFPVIVVKILHYVQNAFSFTVKVMRTMTVTTMSYYGIIKTVLPCGTTKMF